MVKQDTALLQNWLRTVVMSPGYLTQKVGLANRLYRLHEGDVVDDGGTASVHARLSVYSNGYMLRLLDCMYADYAISKKFMGDEVFDSFAKAYLLYHPSTSFTLYDLGRHFPGFLNKTKPKAPEGEDGHYLLIPAELAKVERARQVAMRASGTEQNAAHEHQPNLQDTLYGAVNIEVPQCLQLLELACPMKAFFEAVYHDREYELPAAQKTYMAISRKNYHIVMEEITETQYLLLNQCRLHSNLYEAISALSAAENIPAANLMAEACTWLPFFRKCGFVEVTA